MNEQNSITGVQTPVTPEQNTVPLNNLNQNVAPQVTVPPIGQAPAQEAVPLSTTVEPSVQPLQPVTEVAPTIPVTPVQPLGQEVVTTQPQVQPVQPTPIQPQPLQPATPALEPVATPLTPVEPSVQPIQPQVLNSVQTTNVESVPTVQNQTMFTGQGSTIEESAVQTVQNTVDSTNLGVQNVVQATPGVVSGQNNTLFTAPANNTLANGQVTSEPVAQVTDSSTVGFVSTGSPLPKKKNPVIGIIIGVVVVAILALVGYFVVYPFVVKTFFTKPKDIYTAAIKQVASNITTSIDENIHEKGIYDLSLKLETDVPELEQFADYTYGVRLGVDPKKQNLEVGYSITDGTDEYSNYYYLKNGNMYTRYSTYRDLIYLGASEQTKLNEYFAQIEESLSSDKESVTGEDINYIVNKVSNLLIETLDESRFSKEDASITINGETLKVIKSKYTLDNEILRSTTSHILEGLINDEEFLNILSKTDGSEVDEIKASLEEELEYIKEYEFDDEENNIVMGIYTYGNKVEVVGFELKYNEEFDLHYYSKDGNYDVIINSHTEYDEELEVEASDTSIKVVGVKNGNITNTTISIKEDDEDEKEIAKLAISSWDENKIEFDYTLIVDKEDDEDAKDITGHFLYAKEKNDKKASYTLEFDIDLDEGSLGFVLKFANDWTTDVANINTNAAAQLSEYDLNNIQASFNTYIMTTPLGLLFETISGTQDNDINDYYEDSDFSDDYYYEDDTTTNDGTINNDVIIIQ